MNQIYATLLRSLLGNDVIESTLQEVETEYPSLFSKLAELAMSDGSNQSEMIDYSLHVVDAYLKLKQSDLYTNPIFHKVFAAFPAVSASYALQNQSNYILHFDTALSITLMALMCGLKDLTTIASYSNYANQYLQLILPAMLHPRYRINAVNCRTVMRMVNYELLIGFFENFFTRAKVATKLVPPVRLHEIQPSLQKIQGGFSAASQLHGLTHKDLPGFLPCLGLDHGLLLGERSLLFMCADQLVMNGYDYLLSLNHLAPEAIHVLENRLAATANSKIMIDRIDSYFDILDEISEDMQTVVCIKRLEPTTKRIESFFFISTLPQTEASLYYIQKANLDFEVALKQPGSYLAVISQNEDEDLPDFLPHRQDYNRFVVNVLSYERDLSAKTNGRTSIKPWDVILYRNGNNPICAMASLFYYFLSDIQGEKELVLHQRRRMFDLLGNNPSGAVPRSLLSQ